MFRRSFIQQTKFWWEEWMNEMIGRRDTSSLIPMLQSPILARPRRALANFADSRPASIAHFILRRAGIKPLLAAMLAIASSYGIQPDTAIAATGPSARVSAISRAVVVQSSVQINAGQLSLRRLEAGQSAGVNLRDLHSVGVQSAIRPCDALSRDAAEQGCKMIVYNLP
jgi:hypothetical protein